MKNVRRGCGGSPYGHGDIELIERAKEYNPEGYTGCLRVILALIGLVFLLLTFSGCEKVDDTYCWDCQITFYWQTQEGLYMKEATVEKCDYSELDAQRFENQRSTNPYPISACGDVRWSECICEKK